MSERRRPVIGDRVIYRSAMGESMPGQIVDVVSTSNAPGGIPEVDPVSIRLDHGGILRRVERDVGPEDAPVAVSWRFADAGAEDMAGNLLVSSSPWFDALCAGVVTVLCDAADGKFALDAPDSLPAVLQSFRAGVALAREEPR